MDPKLSRAGIFWVAAAILTLSGCASADPAAPQAPSITTSTQVVTMPAPAAVTVTSTARVPTATPAPIETRTTAAVETQPQAPVASPAPAAAFMPDVVCMNLQDAQNAIQSAGVFFSDSTDASGRGRMQVNDSNWIVTAQTPAAGADISTTTPMLSAVKIGEPNNC